MDKSFPSSTTASSLFGSQPPPSSTGLFVTSTASGGLFGASTTTTASSLFGPQPPSSSSSLFGATKPASSLFGTTTTTTHGIPVGIPHPDSSGSTAILVAYKPQSEFCQVSQPSIFGQLPQQGGIFGPSCTSAPDFVATTTSIFSNPLPSFGFGVQQQPQQQKQTEGLFGPKPSQTFGYFGTTPPQPFVNTPITGSSLFIQPQQPLIGSGLSGYTYDVRSAPSTHCQSNCLFCTAKFTPRIGNDAMQFNGKQRNVCTKQMCITAKKDFDTRSLEEIRYVDYSCGIKVFASGSICGQKQPQKGGFFSSRISTPSNGMFEEASTTTTTDSLFGPQSLASAGLFGQQPPAPTGFGYIGFLGAKIGGLFGPKPFQHFGSFKATQQQPFDIQPTNTGNSIFRQTSLFNGGNVRPGGLQQATIDANLSFFCGGQSYLSLNIKMEKYAFFFVNTIFILFALKRLFFNN